MTQKYENVYLLETAVITGPYEKRVHLLSILIIVMMIYILGIILGNKRKLFY